MRKILFVLAALVLASGSAAAQTKLEVSHFPGAAWVAWIAQDQGFFGKQGLDVHLDPIRGSVRDRGMVSAELAAALPVLMLVLAVAVSAVAVVGARVRLQDAAREAARSARGR